MTPNPSNTVGDEELIAHARRVANGLHDRGNARDIIILLADRLATRPASEGEGWRPIDDEAKRATMVDLWMEAGYRITDAHWGEVDPDDDQECGAEFAWFDDHGDWIEGEDNRATHWRPLPAPPADLGGEQTNPQPTLSELSETLADAASGVVTAYENGDDTSAPLRAPIQALLTALQAYRWSAMRLAIRSLGGG